MNSVESLAVPDAGGTVGPYERRSGEWAWRHQDVAVGADMGRTVVARQHYVIRWCYRHGGLH